MTQYGFFFDQSRCYGCKVCSIACKDWYNTAPGPEKWMSVYMREQGTIPRTRINILAFSCGHCENPVCVSACENGAISKDEDYGAVLVDQSKCQGKRDCFAACPYGAPKFASDEPGTKMSKCTLCIDRLEKGELPVCAVSCPMRALDFGPMDELVEKYGDLRQLPEMPDPAETQPNWIVKPQRVKQPLVAFDETRFIELSKKRGNLGDVYQDVNNLVDPSATTGEGSIYHDSLRMKNATVSEVMAATRYDQG